MSRSSELWLVLGFPADPVPGDPGVVRSYAAAYAKVAESISDASTRLKTIGDKHDSESEFVSKFRNEAVTVADKISKAHHRYAGVATAVANYADPLEDAQNQADAALRLAQSAYDSHQSNTLLAEKYQNELTYNSALSDADKQHYTQLLQHAQTQTNDNLDGINHAKALLQAAMDARDDAANRAANQIENVENTGGLNDSGWTQWWDANGTWVSNVVDAIGIIAAVIILFVPGLDLIEILVISGIAAALAIANSISQWSAGTMSPGEAILNIVIALIPLGGALAAKSALKIAFDAAVETRMTSAAGRAISGVTKSVAAREITEKLAEEAAGSAKSVGKSVWDLLMKNDSESMETLQRISKLSLTVGGDAGKAATVAAEQAWKLRVFLGPVPETIAENVVKSTLDPIFNRLDGKSD